MRRIRVIPTLSLVNLSVVKTIKFSNPKYIGDPINTVRIFNDKEVDELIILDIHASLKQTGVNFTQIKGLAEECFMPVSYGGGISCLADAKKLFDIGIEKVTINSSLLHSFELIRNISEIYGSQSVVGSIDFKKNLFGKYSCRGYSGKKDFKIHPVEQAKLMEDYGAGEILVNDIERDGRFTGYNLDVLSQIASVVNIPVIACGGAGKLSHFYEAVVQSGVSAVAAGSMFVYKGSTDGILINYPSQEQLNRELYSKL